MLLNNSKYNLKLCNGHISSVPNFSCRKQAKNVSFGALNPNFFFIRMRGYGADLSWAQNMTKTAENAVKSLQKGGMSFNELIFSHLGKGYRKFYIPQEPVFPRTPTGFLKKILFNTIEGGAFGLKRTKNYVTQLNTVGFAEFSKYFPYIPDMQRLLSGTKTDKNLLNPFNWIFNRRMTRTKINIDNHTIPLTRIEELKFKHKPNLAALYVLSHTKPKHIPKVLKETEKIWAELAQLKTKPKTTETLEEITEKIASLHWLTVQAMPFNRGSAAISDLMSKTLFEHMGVQVSRWKSEIAPDMEAFAKPLGQFVKEYKYFFEDPLYFM